MGYENTEIIREKIVRPRPLASQYLDHSEGTSIPKGVALNPSSFNVRQLTNLRLEYRLELADVNYREMALAVEVANYLQDAVDAASYGATSLPKKHLNPFQLEQEALARHSEKLEWARNERLKKRKEELQKLIDDAKAKENKTPEVSNKKNGHSKSRVEDQSRRGRSLQHITIKKQAELQLHGLANSPLARLRSPEHLKDLKQKAEEIKKMKEEAKHIAEKERVKNAEIMLFVKKKKNKEFLESKVKQYDSQLNEFAKAREMSARIDREKQTKAQQELAKFLKDAKIHHAKEIDEHHKEKEKIEAIYQECQQYFDSNDEEALKKVTVVFEAYLKLKDPWPVKKDENYYSFLPLRLAQRIFTESEIVPQLISLKRTLELCGRNAKRQKDPSQMNFEEFKLLFFDVAIDFTMYGLKDPTYVRSTTILNRSAMLSGKSLSKKTATPVNKTMLDVSGVSASLASPVLKRPKEKAKVSLTKMALDRPHLSDIQAEEVVKALTGMVDLVHRMVLPTK